MARPMRRAIWIAALVGVAGGGGYLLGSLRQPQPAPAVPAAVSPVEPARADAADRSDLEAAMRRAVKEELAAARPSQSAERAATSAPPAPPTDPKAFDTGMRHVNQAIAQRRWTREDATAFSRALAGASSEQRTTMLRTLTLALNRGELKPAYRGALF